MEKIPTESLGRYGSNLQQGTVAEVLDAARNLFSHLLPGSQFGLEEGTLLPTGWLTASHYRGYLSVPPAPVYFGLQNIPDGLAPDPVLEALLQHFAVCYQLAAMHEELERQARRDWLTNLPHAFQLHRQLDAFGRLLSSYQVGMLELMDPPAENPALRDHLVLQVAQLLRQHTLHAYRMEPHRFVCILYPEDRTALQEALQKLPEMQLKVAWTSTRDGTPEHILKELVSQVELA